MGENQNHVGLVALTSCEGLGGLRTSVGKHIVRVARKDGGTISLAWVGVKRRGWVSSRLLEMRKEGGTKKGLSSLGLQEDQDHQMRGNLYPEEGSR